VTPVHQVAVPAQDGVRSHQQPQSAQHLAGQGREKGGEEGPVLGCELHPVSAELPLQDRDLMPQSQNLCVLVPVPHRQQPQHGERVRDSQISQAQQHERSSCRVPLPLDGRGPRVGRDEPDKPATCTDGILGRRRVRGRASLYDLLPNSGCAGNASGMHRVVFVAHA
jgi:hypothetical protein